MLSPVRLVAVEAAAVDDDLGEPRVADDPDHRPVGVALVLAAVDGALGEQRAALVDHVRAGRDDHDQLAAERVDLQRDLAARQHRVGQVDDQRAEARGQPGAPPGHPAPGPDHLAEPGGDLGPAAVDRARAVLGGQVAGERGEVAHRLRGVDRVQPLGVLGAGQPPGRERAAKHRRRPVAVGVSGPQLKVHPAVGKLAAGRVPKIAMDVSHAPHASRPRPQTRYVASECGSIRRSGQR